MVFFLCSAVRFRSLALHWFPSPRSGAAGGSSLQRAPPKAPRLHRRACEGERKDRRHENGSENLRIFGPRWGARNSDSWMAERRARRRSNGGKGRIRCPAWSATARCQTKIGAVASAARLMEAQPHRNEKRSWKQLAALAPGEVSETVFAVFGVRMSREWSLRNGK
jgi:hypothetical protein